jgi:Domain of unknown function (DUF4926)
MDFPLYSDVILLHDLPKEGLSVGDIGTVVDRHDVDRLETGYSVEFFDMLRNTVAIVTLPLLSIVLSFDMKVNYDDLNLLPFL